MPLFSEHLVSLVFLQNQFLHQFHVRMHFFLVTVITNKLYNVWRHLSCIRWIKGAQASLSFFEDGGVIHERKYYFPI